MTQEFTFTCQCEHHGHFDMEELNGHPEHDYGKEFPASELQITQTVWGKYRMCVPCVSAHAAAHKDDPRFS